MKTKQNRGRGKKNEENTKAEVAKAVKYNKVNKNFKLKIIFFYFLFKKKYVMRE